MGGSHRRGTVLVLCKLREGGHGVKVECTTLGQLGSQVSFLLSLGTDLRLKHEIKAERRLQRIALRGADAKAGHGGSHLHWVDEANEIE